MYAINHLKTIWDRLSEFDSTLASTPNSITSQSENHFFDEEDELLLQYLAEGSETEVPSAIDLYTKIKNLKFLKSEQDVL